MLEKSMIDAEKRNSETDALLRKQIITKIWPVPVKYILIKTYAFYLCSIKQKSYYLWSSDLLIFQLLASYFEIYGELFWCKSQKQLVPPIGALVLSWSLGAGPNWFAADFVHFFLPVSSSNQDNKIEIRDEINVLGRWTYIVSSWLYQPPLAKGWKVERETVMQVLPADQSTTAPSTRRRLDSWPFWEQLEESSMRNCSQVSDNWSAIRLRMGFAVRRGLRLWMGKLWRMLRRCPSLPESTWKLVPSPPPFVGQPSLAASSSSRQSIAWLRSGTIASRRWIAWHILGT